MDRTNYVAMRDRCHFQTDELPNSSHLQYSSTRVHGAARGGLVAGRLLTLVSVPFHFAWQTSCAVGVHGFMLIGWPAAV